MEQVYGTLCRAVKCFKSTSIPKNRMPAVDVQTSPSSLNIYALLMFALKTISTSSAMASC